MLTLAVQCAGAGAQAGHLVMGNSMRKLFDSLFGNREMRVRVSTGQLLARHDQAWWHKS